uniref:HGGxSTG domain-containing protein n=1 Tax=Halocynthiibacter sp. C4 TaxID=2992758 RepID=UPI00237C31C5|nr:HGGxSTG domain-containing protein [Halocynthiibacter sp. C4]
MERAVVFHLQDLDEKRKARLLRQRVICGAKTRTGTPCKRKSEVGRQRCSLHGGKSTGPKTTEGRKRISEAQKERWRRRRNKIS